MKSFSSAQLDYRQARTGVSSNSLVWITAKNRDTGDPESIGFWNGDDHQNFTINGEDRTYYAAGDLLDIEDIIAQVGVVVQTINVTLSGISDEVKQALKGYDARLAPVEIHTVEFDTATNVQIDDPDRVWKGSIDTVVWTEGTEGGESTVTVTIAGPARALTRPLTQKYSNASQRVRNSSDGFFKYTDVAGAADVFWGSKRAPSTAISTPTGNSAPFLKGSK